MNKTFYSLSKEPFPKDISPSEAFMSSHHKGAIKALNYLKDSKGIGILMGNPGMGKSFALRSFAEELNPNLYHVTYYPMSTGGVIDFYRAITYGLGEVPKHRKGDIFRQIQQGIVRMARERKITPVIILDEMHLAKDAFLLDLVLLFNFEMDSSNPFILIMAGLPQLKQRLMYNVHEPLRQRLIINYQINELSQEETKEYIHHFLTLAGSTMPIFTETALTAIAARAQGCPRNIGNLTKHSLLFGSELKVMPIDEVIVQKAAEDIFI